MSVFVSGITEWVFDGVKFFLKPLSGYERELLGDLSAQLEQEFKGGVAGTQRYKSNNAEFRLKKLYFALSGEGAGWDLKDEKGNPVPVTEEAIKKLDTKTWDGLAERIDEISGLTGADQRNFPSR